MEWLILIKEKNKDKILRCITIRFTLDGWILMTVPPYWQHSAREYFECAIKPKPMTWHSFHSNCVQQNVFECRNMSLILTLTQDMAWSMIFCYSQLNHKMHFVGFQEEGFISVLVYFTRNTKNCFIERCCSICKLY